MDVRLLKEWNPWWEQKKVPPELLGRPRTPYQHLLNSTEMKEITIITGVRRSGKSTLMYQMIQGILNQRIAPEQILFVNLDDKKLIPYSIDEIYHTYLEYSNPEKKAYIFLDEIHQKKGWESWARTKYDQKAMMKLVLSGSCSYLLQREYSRLLTGRNISFQVYPLSFAEFLDFKGIGVDKKSIEKGTTLDTTKALLVKSFREYLQYGGFPEIVFASEQYKTLLLEQYFDDILYKDIVDRYTINSQIAKDLGLFLMANAAGLISLRTIRTALKLSYDTIKNYLSYYKEAWLFFTMDHFSYSFQEQKNFPSKIYAIDPGLRRAVTFSISDDEGKLCENMVFLELTRRGYHPYYWRKKGEIDFLIKNREGSLTAINVSYTDKIHEREKKSLRELQETYPSKIKELFILTENVEKKEEGITCLPCWKWVLISYL